MPDKKYKAPNGKIVTQSELQIKYGEKLTSLIQEKTFVEVSEPVYKTPNGSYESESVLKQKYGNKFDELSKNQTFVLDNAPLKKKDPTEPSTVSNLGDGSLDLPKTKQVAPKYKEGTLEWNNAKLKQVNPNFVAKYESVKNAKILTPENKQKALDDVQAEKDNQGIGDYLMVGAKKLGTLAGSLVNEMAIKPVNQALTMFGKTTREDIDANKGILPLLEDTYKDIVPFEEQLKEAKNYQLQQKIKAKKNKEAIPTFTKEQTQEMAEKLFLNKREESYVNTQIKDYFQDNVTDNEKLGLTIFEISNKKTLNEKDRNLLQEQNVQRNAIVSLKGELSEIQSKFKNNKGNQELVTSYKEKESLYNNLVKESINTHKQYVTNREELGSADENLDVFRADYGFLKNFVGKLDASMGDIVAGGVNSVNYLLELKNNTFGNFDIENDIQNLAKGVASDIRADGQKTRDGISKPIAFDDANNTSDFLDYLAFDLGATQVPIFASILLAPGYQGAAALGASALGNKFADMQGEVTRGEKEYSTAEMMLNPVGYGVTETASMVVDKMLLAGAGRVLASATAPERRLIAQGVARRFLGNAGDIVKNFAKGTIYEGLDEGATKGFQNLIDGKPFLEDIKDPIIAGAIMGGLMTGVPTIIAKSIQPFSTDRQIEKASAEILKLQAQLDNPNLDIEVKEIAKTNLDRSKQSLSKLVTKAIGNLESLSTEQFDEVKRIEVAMANVKNQAITIEFNDGVDENIKKQILGNLKNEFDAQNQRRLDLLDRGANVQLERLEDKEIVRLKNLASRELMQEQNPDGTANVTLNNTEISKRAVKIYNKETSKQTNSNAETQSTVTNETQPKAEVQKPIVSEQAKVDGNYIYESKEYIVKDGSITDINGNLLPLDFSSEESTYSKITSKGEKVVQPIPTQEAKIEDVVAPSVEEIKNNELKINGVTSIDFEDNNETVLYGTKNNRTRISIKGMSNEQIQEEYDFDKQVFDKNKNRDFKAKEIEIKKSIGLTDSEKISALKELKTSKRYNDILKNITLPFYETKLNAGKENGNIVANGNLSIGDNTDLQQGQVEAVQPTSNVGESQNDVKVTQESISLPNLDDIADFINQTYIKDGKQEGTTETTTESNQGAESNSVQKNSGNDKSEKSSKLKAKIKTLGNKTPLDSRKVKDPTMLLVLSSEVTNATDIVQQFIIGGGRLTPDSLKEVVASTKGLSSEVRARMSYLRTPEKGGKTFWTVVDSLLQQADDLGISEDDIRAALIDVIRNHNTPKSMAVDFANRNNLQQTNKQGQIINENGDVLQETPYGYMIDEQIAEMQSYEPIIEEYELNQDEVQEVLGYIDSLTELELIELAQNQDIAFNDFVDNLKAREVSFDMGPFSEIGVIQSDGSIINDQGEIFSKQSVSNVKQLNPRVESKPTTPSNKETPELKEVKSQIEKAKEDLRIAKERLQRKAKELDNNLIKDQENLFGDRKTDDTSKLFDERADASMRNKATETERKQVSNAEKNLKNLQETKRKIESGEINSTKEMVFAEVDKIAQKIKDILPGLNDADLKQNGISQDQLIDLIASAVKNLISAGIDINVAIKQVVDSIKAKFGDIDIDIDAVKERINPTPKAEPKKPVTKKPNKKPVDKNTIEKYSFEDLANNMPDSGVFGKFLSGETIEKVTGQAVETIQTYLKINLTQAFLHGENIIKQAKEQFGDNYVSKTLEYVDNYQLDPANVALILNSLENDLRGLKLANPSNITIKKQFDLVQIKAQNYSKSIGQAMNMPKLRNMQYYGYDTSETTDLIYTEIELKAKKSIERALESDADAINNEAEFQENEEENEIEEVNIPTPNRKRNANIVKKELADVWKNMLADVKKASQVGENDVRQNSFSPLSDKQIKAAAPHILKATKLLAELGGLTSKQIVDEIYKNIKGAFPNVNRKDVVNIINNKGYVAKKNTKVAEIVKNALIDAGFGREITVTKKDENGNKVKEKRTVLDWKQLAGIEGSIDNIKKNVEETLKKQGYSDADITNIQQDLITEYNNLRASIVEKSLNELQNRNTKRKVNVKTTSQRMAELYNLGLFEANATEYDNLLNSLLGLNNFDSKTLQKLKERAKVLSELYATKLDKGAIQPKIDEIQKQINTIMFQFAFKKGSFNFKAVTVTQEYMGLSQRMMLHSLGQMIQNTLSGFTQNVYSKAGNVFIGSSTKALRDQNSYVAKNVFADITAAGTSSYGNVDSNLASRGHVEDLLNNVSKNRNYHRVVSVALGRAHLEATDSYFKYILTQRNLVNNLIKILTSKTNPEKMSKQDALRYVSENLTGQSFKDAKAMALELINKTNASAGKEMLADNHESVIRLADSLVKASLVTNGKITQEQLTAANEAAYTSAGFDLGHEANNWLSKQLMLYNAELSRNLAKAITQQNWAEATILKTYQIFTNNIVAKFVGGGTNWIFLTVQKIGLNPVSIIPMIVDNSRANSLKIDVTEDGIKNLKEALMRKTNAENTNVRIAIGSMVTIASYVAWQSLKAKDDDEEKSKATRFKRWLHTHPELQKYFNYMAPSAVAIMIASETKDLEKELGKIFGVRGDAFDDGVKTIKALAMLYESINITNKKIINKVKYDKAMGSIGKVVGNNVNTALPWRTVRDMENVTRSLNGMPVIKTDYKAKGFGDGFSKGGFIEYLVSNPDKKLGQNK